MTDLEFAEKLMAQCAIADIAILHEAAADYAVKEFEKAFGRLPG